MPSPSLRPRIYLAGPDIFLAASAQRFQALKAACARHGLEGLEPSDGGIPADFAGSDDERAQRIYQANLLRIQQADAVLAHLCDFRGLEPDSGTVFEVGYAAALGKPIAAYGVAAQSYATRVAAVRRCATDADGTLRECDSGTIVEGLGQRLNLMLTGAATLHASPAEALAWLAQALRVGASGPGGRNG
ncbi:nucleoside 2-deoxyribosyltransferase [Xenophilus sp. Marseille-Q4582]|uniref:nucleoside 2-deoxyribosyltransferase n=1 Tax=Xenophilus sp. Marseille-Q4582 TaxID=2866600 RepID=UPI001CE48B54|nr:nucleoside 2-deoxyribosyltransferase [Xenophilus sp. Marseille-Q4582]